MSTSLLSHSEWKSLGTFLETAEILHIPQPYDSMCGFVAAHGCTALIVF